MTYPKIFVINLKRSVDRRKHIEKILYELPMEVKFIDAIDAIKQKYNAITACAYSHEKAWKQIQEENLEDAFIMEDDIIIKDQDSFLQILKKKENFPRDWEVILFAHGGSRIHQKGNESSVFHKKKILNFYKIVRFTTITSGALSYLVNQKGVHNLLNNIHPLQTHIDHQCVGNNKVVNLYGIEPVIIEEDDIGKNSIRRSLDGITLEKIKKLNKEQENIFDKIINFIEDLLYLFGFLKIIKEFYHQIRRFKRSIFLIKKYKIGNLEKRK